MTFIEAFEKVKKYVKKDFVDYKDCAIQVELTDEDAHGIMYICVKDKTVYVEPYDYVDNNVSIQLLSKDLIRILSCRLRVDTALKKELLKTNNNSEDICLLSVIASK